MGWFLNFFWSVFLSSSNASRLSRWLCFAIRGVWDGLMLFFIFSSVVPFCSRTSRPPALSPAPYRTTVTKIDIWRSAPRRVPAVLPLLVKYKSSWSGGLGAAAEVEETNKEHFSFRVCSWKTPRRCVSCIMLVVVHVAPRFDCSESREFHPSPKHFKAKWSFYWPLGGRRITQTGFDCIRTLLSGCQFAYFSSRLLTS